MKHIYISLCISTYSNPHYTPDCTLYERVDDGEMTSRKLSYNKARKMQWELVKAGATRTVVANMFKNSIAHVDVDYWACH